MSDTSDQLRRVRESKGLTLADAEKATRIKARYLEAMEQGRWDDLPGPVQARGFLKNYAAFLGLDGEVLGSVQEREAFKTQPIAPLPPRTAPSVSPSPATPPGETTAAPAPAPPALPESGQVELLGLPAWLSLDMIAGGVALFLFAIVALLVARTYALPLINRLAAPPPEPTDAAVILPQVAITPTRTITPTAVFPVNPNGGLQIGLTALEHAWVRITTDGTTAFEGLVTPGKSLAWESREQLIVETGNGAAFNLSVNGKMMGLLGARDQITIRAWSPQGEVIAPPTPTPAPPTETPEPVPTLVPRPEP